ncbi:phosphoribosylanthranilate isomerase [Sneathiella glossodoripedis]|uniref:phosphoribosylanthranilate isomerase n=1 Tax=Sneathiella glossodoripedis TaxID=418853 RepID=UPI000472B5B7|nr:phosphoribosylanthranilate isomerase [Sneathiella glossodoripedis]
MTAIQVKICGLNERASIAAALDAGADFIGAVFYPRSPRSITAEQAKDLFAKMDHSQTKLVGLFVDPSDDLLRTVLENVDLDLIQLHGKETPERVAEIRENFKRPVMKALAIAQKEDLSAVNAYESVSDMLLFDAKAPKSMKDALPGGNGLSFDWNMLADFKCARPWMLAGGLNVQNVTEAVRISGATMVDTSSGVEIKPGHKDPAAISSFIEAVRQI